MALIGDVNDQDFESVVLQNDKPVLVDFWAPGCPPCAALAPILEKVAGDLSEKVKFAKVNAAQERQTANKYRIQAVPTLFIFKNGEIADSFVGYQSEQEIRRRVSSAAGE